MRRFLIVCVLVLAMPAVSLAGVDLKVGVVDLQKALNSVNEGKTAKSKLEEEFRKKQKKLDIDQKEIEEMQKKLQEDSVILSPDKLREKQGELQKKFLGFRETAASYQKEMAEKEAASSGKILGGLKKIAEEIGKKDGFDLVVEKSTDPVLYVKSKDDLTDRIIKLYNERY